MDTFLYRYYPFKSFVNGLKHIYTYIKNQLLNNYNEKNNETLFEGYPTTHVDLFEPINKSGLDYHLLCGKASYDSICGEKGYVLKGTPESIQDGITTSTFSITDFDKQNTIKFDFPDGYETLWAVNVQSNYNKEFLIPVPILRCLEYGATIPKLHILFSYLTGYPLSEEDEDYVEDVTETYLKTIKGHVYYDMPSINPKFEKRVKINKFDPITNEVEIYLKQEDPQVFYDWDENLTWNEDSTWEKGLKYIVDEWVVEIHSSTKKVEIPSIDIFPIFCVPKIILWEKAELTNSVGEILFSTFDGLHFDPDMYQISPESPKIYWDVGLTWDHSLSWKPDFFKLFDHRR